MNTKISAFLSDESNTWLDTNKNIIKIKHFATMLIRSEKVHSCDKGKKTPHLTELGYLFKDRLQGEKKKFKPSLFGFHFCLYLHIVRQKSVGLWLSGATTELVTTLVWQV